MPSTTKQVAPSAGPDAPHRKRRLLAGRQHDQHPVHPPGQRETLPCVYYIHGGGMPTMSCFDGHVPGLGPDHRRPRRRRGDGGLPQLLRASSAPEVAPFPAGLNDCVSGLKWVHANAGAAEHRPHADRRRRRERRRQPDPRHRAEAEAGRRPRPDQGPLRALPLYRRPVAAAARTRPRPRTTASSWTCTTTAAPWATASRRSRRATRWPGRASPPPRTSRACRRRSSASTSAIRCATRGINFYRLLLQDGVAARCRQVMGTIHGTEIFAICCPDISRDTASDIANFARR